MKIVTLSLSLAVLALVALSSAQACPYMDKVSSIKLYEEKVTDAQSTPVNPQADQDRQELIVDVIKKPASTAN